MLGETVQQTDGRLLAAAAAAAAVTEMFGHISTHMSLPFPTNVYSSRVSVCLRSLCLRFSSFTLKLVFPK